jgi:hypothetical protein
MVSINLAPLQPIWLPTLTFFYTELVLKDKLIQIILISVIAQLVQQWAMGWMAGVWFPVEEKGFSLLYSIQTSSGAHPASYPMGTGG